LWELGVEPVEVKVSDGKVCPLTEPSLIKVVPGSVPVNVADVDPVKVHGKLQVGVRKPFSISVMVKGPAAPEKVLLTPTAIVREARPGVPGKLLLAERLVIRNWEPAPPKGMLIISGSMLQVRQGKGRVTGIVTPLVVIVISIVSARA
jgi:hypothetical protein